MPLYVFQIDISWGKVGYISPKKYNVIFNRMTWFAVPLLGPVEYKFAVSLGLLSAHALSDRHSWMTQEDIKQYLVNVTKVKTW